MPSEITMPQLSDTMTEGTVVKWHKKEGEKVNAGEEIADVETDKATMPMEAFESGVLAWIAVKEGGKVKVGERLGVIALPGEDAAQVRQAAADGGTVSARVAGEDVQTQTVAQEATPKAHETRSATQPGETSREASERLRISPLARKIAEEAGVDPSRIEGSGPNGRIVQADVVAFLERSEKPAGPAVRAPNPSPAPAGKEASARPAPALEPLVLSGQVQKISLTKMRSAIATALQRSKQTIPHFYETIDIDVEAITQLRAWMNKALEAENIKLSLSDFVNKALAYTLLRHPALNATFDGQEITRYGDVNLGIATALPDGLIVPVLRGADQLDLRELRLRTVDLTDRARKGRLKREEMTGGTFTVTTLGAYGIRDFGAIINPPEVGILAVGVAEKRAVVRDGQVAARTMMSVTLSCDHRAVDGATGAEFLRALKQCLEEPGALLL